MTDHTSVPTVATGDWIDAAWLNQYLGDNFRAIFQGLASTGMIPYAIDANTVGGLTIGAAGKQLGISGGLPAWVDGVPGIFTAAGDLVYGTGADAAARLGIQNPYRILMSTGSAPFWASLLLFRQGGSATNWQIGGTTNHTPADSFLQGGVIDVTTNSSGVGSVAITYASPFAQRPLILLGVGGSTGGNVTVTFSDDSVTGCTFRVNKADLGIVTVQINWMAIGTPF